MTLLKLKYERQESLQSHIYFKTSFLWIRNVWKTTWTRCSWRPFIVWMQFICGSHNFMFRCNSDFGIDLTHQKSFYVITILELILSVTEIFLCHFDFGSDIINHISCYVILILVLISLTRDLFMLLLFWNWSYQYQRYSYAILI